MRAQLKRAGTPSPRAVGIDEISVRKGHSYRIVVNTTSFASGPSGSAAPIVPGQHGGVLRRAGAQEEPQDRACRDGHVETLPHRRACASAASGDLFDKFHIMGRLGEALDRVRKSEYARLSGRNRRYIKGHKYTLLSRKENLTLEGRQALKTLLRANKRLNTAYLLKESFGQLWSYEHEGWARRFFENWRAALKWQRLKPYEKFADMIDRHWDGIAADHEQGLAPDSSRPQQQNPRHPATGLRPARRRISSPQGSHMHASAAMIPQNHPLDSLKTQFSLHVAPHRHSGFSRILFWCCRWSFSAPLSDL